MRVIGTAGHVDHGKTALIRAMTGIDADRLPEEKARGMTTDLGFAFYDGGDGQAIGVVDVPGHERYLRNMVAGAWGLDLVILVIAADDGWMPQSGLHASIVASLAAPAVVIALTKSDAVSRDRAEAVAFDAVARAAALFGFEPPAVLVSGITGQGIGDLKTVIDGELSRRPEPVDSGAHLFVDRVFMPKGGGVVVTGTLKGGSLSPGVELSIVPKGDKVRLRGIQSYHASVDHAQANCRAALSLAGVKNTIERGDLISVPDSGAITGTEFLCRLLPLPGTGLLCPVDQRGRPVLRQGVEAELAIGSAWRDANISTFKSASLLRVVLDKPLACPAGSPFAILRRGGAELLGRGVVLEAGTTTPAERKMLDTIYPDALAAASALVDSGLEAGEALRFAMAALKYGQAVVPKSLTAETIAKAGFEWTPSGTAGGTAFAPGAWKKLSGELVAATASPGGMARADAEAVYAKAMGSQVRNSEANTAALDGAIARLESEGALIKSGSHWNSSVSARNLTQEESEALARLTSAGKSGLEPGKSTPQIDARVLRALCSFGEAVPLDGGIYFAKSTFDECAQAILRGRKSGDRFSVPEAKERSGLSRKYILPLLNRMESKGLVKRLGDERVVV
jgi:selenocysteine-specific elongation factor